MLWYKAYGNIIESKIYDGLLIGTYIFIYVYIAWSIVFAYNLFQYHSSGFASFKQNNEMGNHMDLFLLFLFSKPLLSQK